MKYDANLPDYHKFYCPTGSECKRPSLIDAFACNLFFFLQSGNEFRQLLLRFQFRFGSKRAIRLQKLMTACIAIYCGGSLKYIE